MEEQAKSSALKPALIYGAIIGFVSIVISVVLDLLGLTFATWAGILSFVITVGLVSYALSAYKKEYLGGFASYQQLMLMTLLMALISSALTTIYAVINITIIDPDALEKMFNMAYDKFANNPRMSDEMLDAVLERMEGKFTAGRVIIQSFVGGYVMTVIIGVVAAAIIKKEQDGPAANIA